MYIGGVNAARACTTSSWEVLDNSVDEAMNGHASEITLTLHKTGDTITVGDNGRGIPVDRNKKTGKSGLELVLTELHAGGKFQNEGEGNYKTAGGLHGVGASVVNALSKQTRRCQGPSRRWSNIKHGCSRRGKRALTKLKKVRKVRPDQLCGTGTVHHVHGRTRTIFPKHATSTRTPFAIALKSVKLPSQGASRSSSSTRQKTKRCTVFKLTPTASPTTSARC